jgi:hypothetical protein
MNYRRFRNRMIALALTGMVLIAGSAYGLLVLR